MQITPIEIRQKRFEKKFIGYHSDEVDAFLHSLAYTWEKLTTQLNELKITLEDHKKELNRLQDLEGALLKTIKDSEVTANNILAQANREGELIIREAEIEVEKLLHEARNKAQTIEEGSRSEADQLKNRVDRELIETKQATQEAIAYRDRLVQQLQQFAEEVLAKSQAIQGAQPEADKTNQQEPKKEHNGHLES